AGRHLPLLGEVDRAVVRRLRPGLGGWPAGQLDGAGLRHRAGTHRAAGVALFLAAGVRRLRRPGGHLERRLFRGRAPAPPGASGPRSPPPAWTRQDWFRLVPSVPMILLCGQQFFRACGMAFFYTWFATFLQETRGVNLAEAGLMTGAVGLGAMAGGILGGLFSDWLLRRTGNRRLSRQGIAVAGLSLCSALLLLSAGLTSREVAIAVITLGAFAAAFGGVSGYTVAIEFGGTRVATIFSVMNMCGNIGAALFPAAVGTLIDTTGDWNLVLYLFAGILAIDALFWALLNPRHPLFQGDDEPH